MASTIELITRSAANTTPRKTLYKPGEAAKAEAGAIYDMRVDGQPVPKGTKIARKGSKLQFTFPDGSTFEINEWCGVQDSKFAELLGTLGYDDASRKFVDIQSVESGECRMISDAGQPAGSLGAPSTMNLGAILGGLALAGLGGGGGGAAVVLAQPGTPSGKLAAGSAAAADSNVTASSHPSLSGKSNPGDRISVRLPTGEVLNTVADAQGNWTVTPVTALPDGDVQIMVTATSKDGVVGTPTIVAIVVDTTAPGAPAITSITENSDGHISGTEAANGTQVQLALAGTNARAGDTVHLNWGSEVINHVLTQAEIDAGAMTIEIPASVIEAVGNGDVPVTVSITDSVGNAGDAGPASNALVAFEMPASAPDLTAPSDSGASSADNITSEAQPVFSIGTVPAGYSAVLLIDGVVVPAHAVTTDGVTTLQPDTPLSEGNHSVAVAYVDAAGVQSPASPAADLVIDTITPPDTPVAPTLSAPSDTGSNSADLITSDYTPSFELAAPPAQSSYRLWVDGVVVPSIYDPVTGTLTPVDPLPAGDRDIAVSTIDLAGNESAVSPAQTVTIVDPPATPANAPDMLATSDSGSSGSDDITATAAPSLLIDSPDLTAADLTPVLYVDGVAVASSFDPLTNELVPDVPLSEGPHSLSYTLADINGIESAQSPALAIIVDTLSPDAPAAAPDMTSATDLGTSSSDDLTMDNTPSFTVPALAAGESATLYVDGVPVAATWDAVNNTLTPLVALLDGAHTITSTITDAAGNESAHGAPLFIMVDATASAAPAAAPDMVSTTDSGTSNSDNLTSDTTPTFTVPAPSSGESATLYVDGVAVAATWDAVNHTLTPTVALTDGAHIITSTVTDAAGNESAPSAALSVTIDATAAAAPAAPDMTSATDSGTGNSDNLSNDSTPTFTVPALAVGEIATLYVDGVAVAATWDAVNHTLTPVTPLADGPHAITSTITDAAGNESAASAALNVIIDSAATDTPAAAPDLATLSDTGLSNSDNVTGDSTPAITMPALAVGEFATLYVDGLAVAATWDVATNSLIPDVPLSVGMHTVAFSITDAAGNESGVSPTLGIEVQAAPAAPSALVDMVVGDDSGTSSTDNITSVSSPLFVIPAPTVGLTPTLYIDGVASAATFDALTNTFTLPAGLADGTYALTYTLTNIAGAESGASPALSLVIDTTASAAPAAAPDMTAATDLGTSSSDDLTMDDTPTFTLPALASGEIATLYVDGIAVAATWDAINNTLTPTVALADGAHVITSTITDAAGNEGLAGAALAITVDATASAAPAAAPDMTSATDSGTSNSDNLSNDGTPTFTVPAPSAGEIATLYVDGIAVAATWDAVNNTLTPTVALTDGAHTITSTITDAAGNESAPSAGLSITVDATASAAPASAPDMTSATDSGSSNSDNTTSDTTPTFTVPAPASGEIATLYVDGIAVAATWDAVNHTLTPTVALTDGTHVITSTITDAAGNESVQSAAVSITVDTTASAAPAAAPDMTAATDLGTSSSDDLTMDSTPTFTVPAPSAGEIATLYVDGVAVAATWDAVNNTLTPTVALTDGVHTITSTITDAAGNESAPGAALSITVDATASAAPATAPDMTSATDSGSSNSDNTTSDTTPTFTVPAPASGEIATLYVDGIAVAATWDAVNNTLTPTVALTDGVHTITSTITDAAGNESAPSAALSITVDATASAAPAAAPDMTSGTDSGSSNSDNTTSSTTPTFTVPAPSAGEIATLYVDGIAVAATWDAVNHTLTPSVALADGAHVITSTITDAAGNESAQSAALSVTVDTTASAAPAVAPDMTTATDLGSDSADDLTSDGTPTFTVPAPSAGESLKLYVDGVAVAAVWDALNNTLTPVAPLTEGPHSITSSIVDAAGNESAQSPALSISIDLTASAVPAAPDMTAATDSGTSNTDDVTNVTTPGFTVAAPAAGESVNLYVDGILVAAAWDSVNNRLTPLVALSDGPHLITTSITDEAGNESAQGAALSITIDTIATPAATPDMTSATDSGTSTSDNLTRITTPTFTVPAPMAGETVRLYVDGVAVAATWDALNNTLTPTVALIPGVYSITSTVTDAAGNESAQSSALSVTIDTAASAAPSAALNALSDSGTAGDSRTNDQTPTLSGTGIAGETITVVFPGTGETMTTTVAGNGTWSVTATSNIANGTSGNATVTTTDAAGNTSSVTNVALIIDSTAPTLSSASPADNAVNVMPSGTITLNYSENIALGSGHQTITLYNFTTGAVVETFDATTGLGSNGGTLSISGGSVTLNLGSPMAPGTHYDVQMQAGAITDVAGNMGAAIATNTALDFTTVSVASTVSVTNLATTTYSAYLHSINPNLVSTNAMGYVPGSSNFGTALTFGSHDDDAQYQSITPAFASGLNFFGTTYNQVGIGTNGYMTFNHLNYSYTASGIPGYMSGGMIASQYDDWAYGGWAGPSAMSAGGNSLGTDAIYFAAYQNAGMGVVTLTYDDVGEYAAVAPGATDGLTTNDYSTGNAQQIRLIGTAAGETIIQIVYENVSWVNGNTGFPTAGWTKGDGLTYGTVDGNIPGASSGGISGTVNFLDVELASNVGIAGVFEWVIGADGVISAGTVPMIDTHATGAAQDAARLSATGGTVTYAQDATHWDSRFTLIGDKIQANAGASFLPSETEVELWVQVHDNTSGITYPKLFTVQLFDQVGGAGNDEIGLRAASDISKLTSAVASQVVMNGKGGEDTLVFTGTGLNLDMTAVQDSALINVERIDLGTGNTVKLALADVFSMSAANQFNSGNGWTGLPATVTLEQLVVDGNATDTVTIMNSGAFVNQWNTTSAGTATHGGHTYAIYNSLANTGQLLVDQNVNLVFG